VRHQHSATTERSGARQMMREMGGVDLSGLFRVLPERSERERTEGDTRKHDARCRRAARLAGIGAAKFKRSCEGATHVRKFSVVLVEGQQMYCLKLLLRSKRRSDFAAHCTKKSLGAPAKWADSPLENHERVFVHD
jgi:hypothetical protein